MIRISDAGALDGRIEFIYNPLSELSLALDLLCNPDHHPLHRLWASSVINRLSRKEKEQLYSYEKTLDGYLNLDLHIDYLSFDFTSSFDPDYCRAFLVERINWISEFSVAEMERLAAFLVFMWESYVSPVVEEHRDVLLRQIGYGRRILKDEGVSQIFSEINDRISFGKNEIMKIEKWVDSSFCARDLRCFYIELTLFAFPHLVISDRHLQGGFFLSWDAPFRADSILLPGIDRISSRAFALSDKSRLRILLMLSGAPMTQKELARQMGFAKSTISRHIGILLDAGIIEAGGSGRNVLLRLSRETLEDFSNEITAWLL